MRGWIIGIMLAAVPSPCFASYDIICDGKPGTPHIDVKVGSSEMVIYRVIVDGLGEFRLTEIRQRTARGGKVTFDLLRQGRAVAAIRLADSRGPLGWVGTMQIGRRKYRLTCGEMG